LRLAVCAIPMLKVGCDGEEKDQIRDQSEACFIP
jgi:hypothetical protein